MNSLIRSVLVVAVAAGLTAACGGDDSTPYITPWVTPLASMQAGTTQPFVVKLSMPVKDKTFIDIEISGTDQQYVSTSPADYLTVAPQSDTAKVDITAKVVTEPTQVKINFKIRDSTESRAFSFQINP